MYRPCLEHFLKEKTEEQLRFYGNKDRSKPKQLTKWNNMITRRRWVTGTLHKMKNKKVVPKRELFQVLSRAYSQSNYRKVASRNYAEISQKVVNTSILCTENAQRPIAMAAPIVLRLSIEIELMVKCLPCTPTCL